MAAGDVTVSLLATSGAAIDTAVTAARVNANSKFYFVPISNGQQMYMIHIEEA